MIASSSVWLLAAYLTIVIAGPLPHLRHQFFSLHYFNTSSTLTITSKNGSPNTLDLTSTSSSIPAIQSVEANTVVMVEPIDHTVFTRTEAAITFVNPKGEPLVTQPEETVLSTSYITKPSPTETSTPKASPRASSLAALETSKSTQDFGFPVNPSGRTTTKPSEHLSGNTTASGTAPQGPMFTYEPEDATSTAEDTSRPTITITISSFTTLTQGLNSTASQTALSSAPSNTNAVPTSALLQSTMAPSSSYEDQSITSTGVKASSSVRGTVFVTSTDYTTLYPSSSSTSQISLQPSSQSTLSAVASETEFPTLTRPSPPSSTVSPAAETSSSSTPPQLPTSSLSPPPIIVITSSAPGSSEPAATSTAEIPPLSETMPSRSQAVEQPSSGGGGFAYPTRQPSASSDAPSVSSPAPPSSSTEAPSASSVAPSTPPESTPVSTLPPSSSADPPLVPSATSSGPLVVVPIDTSQIFTVTWTFTTTTTEKETVTVTATVTA